ncbi:MAG: hypothetical protein ABEK50_04800 [bacterium]
MNKFEFTRGTTPMQGYLRGISRVLMVLVVLTVFDVTTGVAPLSAAEPADSVEGSSEVPKNPIRDQSYYVGLYYPGLTLGYQGNGYSLELRGSSQDDIQLVGARYSKYVYPYQGGNLYLGLDGYHVEGNGYMVGGVGGLQTYLGNSLSFTIDGGPYHIKLNDDISGVQSSGIQFVVNTGINIHF